MSAVMRQGAAPEEASFEHMVPIRNLSGGWRTPMLASPIVQPVLGILK
jgi:hypothetical protein